MLVAPTHESHDGWKEVASGEGEPVLAPIGIAGVGDAFEQAGIDEGSQTGRECRSRDAEIPGELPESSHTEEGFTEDQQGPTLAD